MEVLSKAFRILRGSGNSIAVLMYHKVDLEKKNKLTVTLEQLEQHFLWLKACGVEFLSLSRACDIFSGAQTWPSKFSVCVTFDDAYLNNHSHLRALVVKHQVPIGIFLPVKYLGLVNEWDGGDERIMGLKELKECYETGFVEFGLHSYGHKNYGVMSPGDIRQDLRNCFHALESQEIPYVRGLAYPYGARPKSPENMESLRTVLKEEGIASAFRIGNRLNRKGSFDPYEIERLDVQGSQSFVRFKLKVMGLIR